MGNKGKKKQDKPAASPTTTGTTASTSAAPAAAAAAPAPVTPAPAPVTPSQAAQPAATVSSSESASKEVDELTALIKSITLSGRFNTKLAVKPEKPGTLGTNVKLVTNMFRMTVKEGMAYHYDLTFKAEAKKKQEAGAGKGKGKPSAAAAAPVSGDTGDFTVDLKVRKVVSSLFEQLKRHDKDFLKLKAYFDGKQNMFTLKTMMPQNEKEVIFVADVDGEERKVKAKYAFTGHSLDLSRGSAIDADAKQALEIGLGYEMGKELIQRGSKFFERTIAPKDVGMNLELRLGFVKSVRATGTGLCINLDRAAALFQKGGPLADVMMNVVNFNVGRGQSGYTKSGFRMTPILKSNLERELSNLKFEFRNPGLGYNRKYKLDKGSISMQNVSDIKFDFTDSNGRTSRISVFQYFQQQYKITLRFTNLPCIAVGKDKKNFLPVEMCHLVPEQYYDKKMSERIQRSVTDATIKPPQERYDQIMASAKQMKPLAQATVDCEIVLEPVKVIGRKLDPPKIAFGQRTVTVSSVGDGKFTNPCDFRQQGPYNAAIRLDRWAIVQVQDNSSRPRDGVHLNLITFANNLVRAAKNNGFMMNEKFGQLVFNYKGYASLRAFMVDHKTRNGVQLFLFVIPSDMIYNDIKKIANELGITTQCLALNVDDNFAMGDRGKINKISGNTFVNNMLLKMNAKLGGINAKLDVASMPPFLKKNKCMIVGMDVFHPGPGSEMRHSLAGLVASYTPSYTKYFQAAKAQPNESADNFKRKEEITAAVYDAMIEFFTGFKEVNKFYPDFVIVFRDGVSEGQFEKVRIIELDQIYRAMQKLGFKAKVTFITVQKRHHFRMFEDKGNGKVDNPQPGTVIDKDVVHPIRFECYLNSHFALKGTSKPCHYCVVHNECNLSVDDMQLIAYYLCYLCARCYKPISVPIPVKYAHLVSEQASKSLESAQRNKLQGTVDEWIKVHPNFADKLNYA